MEALIDTDIISYYLKGYENIRIKVEEYLLEHITLNLSSITCYEVLSGLEYKQATRQINDFELFINDCNIINISDKSIRLSEKVCAELRRKGIIVGNSDLLIAGIALEHNLTLIINNEKHFSEIANLNIDNWNKTK